MSSNPRAVPHIQQAIESITRAQRVYSGDVPTHSPYGDITWRKTGPGQDIFQTRTTATPNPFGLSSETSATLLAGDPIVVSTLTSLLITTEQLNLALERMLAVVASLAPAIEVDDTDEDDWGLTAGQTFFMLQHHNDIEAAFRAEDFDELCALAETLEYREAFGDMSFDEAYDRYLTWLEAGSDAT